MRLPFLMPFLLRRKLKNIKAVVFDVDGILTDGKVWMDDSGNWKRAFHIQDGLGIKRLIAAGYKVGWITGSKSTDIVARASNLGVHFLRDGVEEKTAAFEEFALLFNLRHEQIAYAGDDLPDIGPIEKAGVAIAVPNAVHEVQSKVDHITSASGGSGSAREIAELIIRVGYHSQRE